jgi:hypothetical protein
MSNFFPYRKAWWAFIKGGAFIRNFTVFVSEIEHSHVKTLLVAIAKEVFL